MAGQRLGLRAGETVEVRSLQEIMATLDEKGRLEALPFMPEMTKLCGQKFTVHKRGERVCVEGYKARGMNDTVFLKEIRCDGSLHDGCKRGCLMFWKEAWLKRPGDPAAATSTATIPLATKQESGASYYCQSSELHLATYPLNLQGTIRTYLRDIMTGNLTIAGVFRVLYISIYRNLKYRSPKLECGTLLGETGVTKTPAGTLDLQAGDWVEVKTIDEIKPTLDEMGRNRGLHFVPEMIEYTGKRFKVAQRIDSIILEMNGEMKKLTNTVTLDTVTCTGVCKRGCPRNGFHLWRELWLKKVDPHATH